MRLRIWLSRLAELRPDSEVSFEVLGKGRRVQHRAVSTIAGLPKGLECELVFPSSDVVLLDIRPPRLSGSKLAGALPSLIEERLVGNVDEVHVVATPRAPDGTAVAALVDRALLRRTLEIFARLNRTVVAAVPSPLAVSFVPGRWRARIAQGLGSVRTGPASGIAFTCAEEVPVELRLLASQATAVPAVLEVDGDCDVEAWSQALGTPVKQVGPEDQAPAVPLDLLQYQFAPGFADWGRWRVPVALAVILVIVTLAGLNLHARKLRGEEAALRERMVAIVKETIPGVPAVLDPSAQMQRRLDQLRVSAGINSADFLSVALELGSLVDADAVHSMQYRDKALTVEFEPGTVTAQAAQQDVVSRAVKAGLVMRFTGNRATVRRREAR